LIYKEGDTIMSNPLLVKKYPTKKEFEESLDFKTPKEKQEALKKLYDYFLDEKNKGMLSIIEHTWFVKDLLEYKKNTPEKKVYISDINPEARKDIDILLKLDVKDKSDVFLIPEEVLV